MIQRIGNEPVVRAGSVDGYGAIFNAGLLHHDGRYHLFARAVRDGYRRNAGPGPRFLDYVSDVLVFESVDGIAYEFGYVLAEAGDFGVDCFEDPRAQVVRSDDSVHIVITYTNLPHPDRELPWRIGAHLLSYSGDRFSIDEKSGRLLGPDGMQNKDAVVFNLSDGRVALIHRLHPNMQIALFDSLEQLWDADDSYWDEHVASLDEHTIITPRPGSLGVGAGAPPLIVDEGLLLFFHERRADGAYTARVALLDPADGRVIQQLEQELFEPELLWEREGDVDDVVFVQGAHRRDDGSIYLTYGAADSHVGAAVVDEAALLRTLMAGANR